MTAQRGVGPSAVILSSYDPISYACVRSLGRRNVHTIVAAERTDVPASSSRFCDEIAVIPCPKDDLPAFVDGLLDLAARQDVRTIVPTRPEDCYVLSKYRESFEEHVSLPVPSFETLQTVFDRYRLYEVAMEANVPVPETCPLSAVETLDGEAIIKSRYNVLAEEFHDDYSAGESAVVKDVEHVLPDEEIDESSIRERMGHDPIVQEFVDYDEEFMFAGLYDHGDPLATFQHHQIRGNSYTGGGGVYRRSIADPELEETAHRLLEQLDFNGLACIEYMRDAETGEFVLTEINPRMWQSLASTVRAGGDFPHYYWLAATDQCERIDPSYDLGVGSHLLYGELGHLYSIIRDDSPVVERPSLAATTFEIARSFCTDPSFDFFHLDDPKPFLMGLRRVLPGSR